MSGHSKWATTKRAKAVTDAKRSVAFTKLAKTISVAARAGGDPEMNFNLRLAIEKAKQANMPKDNIDRAVKRGTGELGGAQIEEILYEAYGPHSTAILIEVLTDNKNRTLSEIKAILNKLGGKLASSGAVSYLFTHRGEMKVAAEEKSDEEVELVLIDSGAEDYEKEEDGFIVYTKPTELAEVKNFLELNGLKVEGAGLIYVPKTTVSLSDEQGEKIIHLLETLEDLDDVSAVHSNAE